MSVPPPSILQAISKSRVLFRLPRPQSPSKPKLSFSKFAESFRGEIILSICMFVLRWDYSALDASDMRSVKSEDPISKWRHAMPSKTAGCALKLSHCRSWDDSRLWQTEGSACPYLLSLSCSILVSKRETGIRLYWPSCHLPHLATQMSVTGMHAYATFVASQRTWCNEIGSTALRLNYASVFKNSKLFSDKKCPIITPRKKPRQASRLLKSQAVFVLFCFVLFFPGYMVAWSGRRECTVCNRRYDAHRHHKYRVLFCLSA